MNTSVIALLSFLLGGGGGDLLDYVATDAYWKSQDVQVSVETMSKELAAPATQSAPDLIGDLGSADAKVRDDASAKILKMGPGVLPDLEKAISEGDPEITERARVLSTMLRARMKKFEVRRLLAIRTLGELKQAEALPLLQPLAASKDFFVADYAKSAIEQISGKPGTHPRAAHPRDDVWQLPASSRAVIQLVPRGSGPIVLNRIAAALPVRSNQDPGVAAGEMSSLAQSAAEQLGNVRVDSISLGLSEDFNGRSGFVTAIVNGQFDAKNAAEVIRVGKIPFKLVGNQTVFQPDGEITLFLPSDHQLVFMASPAGEAKYPLPATVASILKGDKPLKNAPEMVKLIDAVDPDASVWAAVKMTGPYAFADPLSFFDTIKLSGVSKGGSLRLTLAGELKDAANGKAAVAAVNELVAGGREELQQLEPIIPSLKAAEDLIATVQCDAKGAAFTGTAYAAESAATMFMLPLTITFGTHSERVPPPTDAEIPRRQIVPGGGRPKK